MPDNYDGPALVEGSEPPLILTVRINNIAAPRSGWLGHVLDGDITRLTGPEVTLVLLGDVHKGWTSVARVMWAEGRDGVTAHFNGRAVWTRP